MSKIAPAVLEAPRSWLILSRRISDMETVEQVKKAFHEARIVGEQLLSKGKISWEEFAFTMVGFELQLREMGSIYDPYF